MAIIQDERLRDVLHHSLWMSYSDTQQLSDTGAVHDMGCVAYISGFMERFVRSENLFTPDSFDTLTQRFIALGNRGKSFYNREVADFSLFLLGMAPERLVRRGMASFYADTGATSYSWLYTQSSFPTFHELGRNFTLYCDVITNTRDRYMRIENDGSVRIVPVYENVRFRGIQDKDGSVRELN